MKLMYQKLKANNQGLSMIELIVIMGILSVIFAVTSFSLALTPSTEAKKVVSNVDAMISRTKVGTLAKTGDVYMEIYINSAGKVILNYYEDDKLKETDTLTKKDVTIYYDLDGGATKVELTKGKSLILAFDRRTTGFVTLKDAAEMAENRNASSSSGVTSSGNTNLVGGDVKCNKIWVAGGTVEYYIEIGPTTGTHYKSIK